MFWNSIAEERQEFKLSTKIPYVFNSRFTPKISFSIYKQDSTFLNTKFNSELFFNINPRTEIALIYSSESSENLNKNINNAIETYNNSFLGFSFFYRTPKNDFFFNDKFFLETDTIDESLEEVYQLAAKYKNINIEKVIEIVNSNFNTVFKSNI